jgi:hypothetical protein
MTGFLQRLASSAARPGTAIHPVQRPLYADPTADAVGADLEADAAMSDVPADRRAVEPSKPHHPPPAAGQPRVLPVALPAALRVPGTKRQDTTIAVRPPRPDGEDGLPGLPPPSGSRSQHSSIRYGGRGEVPNAQEAPAQVFVKAPRAPSIKPVSTYDATLSARSNLRSGISRAREPASDSGDIQVHIERIEVTAVHPAPSQPKRPRRLAPSLDEYLKRGTGGAS